MHCWIAPARSSSPLMSSVCPSQAIIPARRSPSCSWTAPASATAAEPGSTPARFMPTLSSTTTGISTPTAWAAAPSSSSVAVLSTAILTLAWRCSAAMRAYFCAPTTWLAIRMSRTPAATITSASPGFAQVTPSAPASIILWAIAGIFMPFVCGRQFTPASLKLSISSAMLRSNISRSTHSAGVSSSSFARPISVIRFPHTPVVVVLI